MITLLILVVLLSVVTAVLATFEARRLLAELGTANVEMAKLSARAVSSEALAKVRAHQQPPNPFGIVIAGEEPGWTDGDRERWSAFLKSETGQRLRQRIIFYEQGQNRKAVLLMDATAAARAAGFHDCGAWLESHSADVPPLNPDDSNHDPAGVRAMIERLTP